MNLNVGSGAGKPKGQYKTKEWINIDLVAGDVRASGCDLPFKSNTFDEIHAFHVLEHIPRKEHSRFHSEMHRVLKPGGIYYVEVPNLLDVCEKLTAMGRSDIRGLTAKEKERIRCLTLSIYGKNRHTGDAHCWGFMPYLLFDDLSEHKFSRVEKIRNTDEFPSATHRSQEEVILFRAVK